MDILSLATDISNAVIQIDAGRKGFATRGKEQEGRKQMRNEKLEMRNVIVHKLHIIPEIPLYSNNPKYFNSGNSYYFFTNSYLITTFFHFCCGKPDYLLCK